jgi:hypothetical protein
MRRNLALATYSLALLASCRGGASSTSSSTGETGDGSQSAESNSASGTADDTAGGPDDGCPWTITPLGTPVSSTAHVRVFFSVTGVGGTPIEDLSCADFTALENASPVDPFESALNVRPPQGLLRIPTVLVLDLSRSVVDAGALETVKDSARAFIDAVAAPQELAIVTFSGEATVRAEFTDDKATLNAAIDAITMEDGVSTNLYGALVQGYSMWQDGFVEVGEGPTTPISCVPGFGCSDAPGETPCPEYCMQQGYESCDAMCDANTGTSGGCEASCASSGYASCDEYCTQNGYVDGCDPTTLSCVVPDAEGLLTAGLLVVISDGNDTAAVATLEEVIAARGSKRTLFVAVGAEYDLAPATEIANAGLFDADDFSQLETEVATVIQKTEALANSIYIAEYCSPKRAGSHQFSLQTACGASMPEATCQPTGTGPSCSGADIFCGFISAEQYVCCDTAYPYHCPGGCYTTAEAAMADCGSTCGSCGVPMDAVGGAGPTLEISFEADGFADDQCASLFDAASVCD